MIVSEGEGVKVMEPLYYQFAAERQGAFTWRYLEEGPEVWRVEIGKT